MVLGQKRTLASTTRTRSTSTISLTGPQNHQTSIQLRTFGGSSNPGSNFTIVRTSNRSNGLSSRSGRLLSNGKSTSVSWEVRGSRRTGLRVVVVRTAICRTGSTNVLNVTALQLSSECIYPQNPDVLGLKNRRLPSQNPIEVMRIAWLCID